MSFFIYVFFGVLIGILAELAANKLKLWLYRAAWMPVINILIMFGLIEGAIAFSIQTPLMKFIVAATAGTLYDIANFKVLHWWQFPDNKMGPIKGEFLICVVLACAWGVVPIFIHQVAVSI